MKAQLREKMQEKRLALSRQEIEEKSEAVKARLWDLQEFQANSKICFYYSKEDEVATEKMIEEVFAQGKEVFLPVTLEKEGELKITRLKSLKRLIEGPFGVKEPEEKEFVSPETIDLFIVPGVAFDRQCSRLGRGKGFYDRLLCQVNGKKVGLSFEEQMIKEIKTEEHDVAMDLVVTEKRIIRF